MSLEAGRKLGPYEIVEPIGKGGMGEVYRARDAKLDRDVAIKVLPDEFANDDERLARFEREAKLLASLNHPNIASIYGFESNALVLELVEGPTLAQRIAQGPIPVEEAIAIAKQIAEALEAGHEAGVIHRDLKPANVKVREDGTVKVLDYGLAKALEGDGPACEDSELSQSPTLTRQGTQVGVILGTAAYMSPEQAKGKRVDKRTDIWAFGAVVYEMLTGSRAFGGEDVSDTLAAVLKDEPDWARLPPATPVKLRQVLRRCLRRDAKRRVHDIADARIEIEEARDVEVIQAPGRTGFAALVLAAVTASVVTGVAFRLLGPSSTIPSDAPRVNRSVLPLPVESELHRRFNTALAISPDGSRAAYVVERDGARQLYLRSLDSLTAQPILGTEDALIPFFSPDGRWVGFYSMGALRKVSISGGAPVVVAELSGEVRGATWATEETIIFATQSAGLARVSAAGGLVEVVSTPDFERGEKTHRFPSALPGGKDVLFTFASGDIGSFDEASIGVFSLETGEHRILIQGGSNAHYVSSGHLVYARAGTLVAVPFDVSELAVIGPPASVLDGVAMDPISGNAEVAISAGGHLLYAPGTAFSPSNRVIWLDRHGRMEPLTQTTGYFSMSKISPNGERLAVFVGGANNSIWTYDIARESLTRLVFGFDNHNPIWTPDGERVTFGSNRSGAFNIYWQAADGSTPPERLTTSDFRQVTGSWSPDGNSLAYSEMQLETGWDMWVLSVEGERAPRPFAQSASNERAPQFSPDGRFLAYVSDETGRSEVYVQSFPSSGKKWQVSTEGGGSPLWNPARGELLFANGREIMAADVDTRAEFSFAIPERLYEAPASLMGPFDVSRDGERLIFVDRSAASPPPTQLVLVLNWSEELKRLVPAEN